MRRYGKALVLALLALLLSACDVRIATEIVVTDDYSGELVVSLAVDEATASDLIAAGLVPDSGLQEVAASAPGWTVEPIEGLTASVRLSRAFEHVDEVGPLLDALGSQLGPEDGALWDGLRMRVDADGQVVLDGRAGLIVPTVAGAVGTDVTFDGDDLARLLDEEGREAVRHDLRVTSPGRPGANDADVIVDNALVWELPVGEYRSVRARLPIEQSLDTWRLAAVGLVVAVFTAVVTLLTRRRSRDG